MALSKLWTNYSAKLHTLNAQAAGAVYIDSIADLSLNTALSTQLEGGDGSLFASFGSLIRGGPVASGTSLNLKSVLDALGVTSMLVDADGSHPGVVYYFRKITTGGTRDAAGSGTHISVTIPNGIMVPRRISARNGENARIEFETIATQLGVTAPVAYSASANLPGNTPGTSTAYALGPVSLNGTKLDGVDSVDVDLGVNLLTEGKDSDVYPTVACVATQRPSIRVRGAHVDVISTLLTADGLYYTASQVLVYFRKRSEGGTYVADGTAQHVKFTLGKCRVEVQSFGSDPKMVDLLITPWQDTGGAVNPIAVNTASVIA